MKYALREVSAALMLGVVGLLGAVIALASVAAVIVSLSRGGAWALAAAIAIAAMLAAVGAGLLARRRRLERDARAGVSITTDEQPLLWVEVYRVAEGLSIRPPDELLLFPDAAVAVSEARTWLGLRPGVRRLHLGLVLLAGLTERELRAVIAQEFFRCWGPLSLSRVIYRGHEMVGRVADRVGEDSKFGRILGWYRGTYFAVSRPVIRRHELESGRVSADLAGNNAAAAALREGAVLNKGWAAFVDGYAGPAAAAGRRPEHLFAGFTSFLDEPGRRAQLAGSADEPASSHPEGDTGEVSLEDRLAAIASLAQDDICDKSGPALGVMRNPDHVIRRVEESMFRESDFVPSTWEDIVPEAGVAAAREDAVQLQRLGTEGGLGQTLTVATLLELLRHGLVDEMVRPIAGAGAGASQEAERRTAGRLVIGFLATAAIESGTASYRFSWAAPQLVDHQGAVDDLPLLVAAALADPDEVPALELWLESHRVGPQLDLEDNQGQPARIDPPGSPSGRLTEDLVEKPAENPSQHRAEDLAQDLKEGSNELIPPFLVPASGPASI